MVQKSLGNKTVQSAIKVLEESYPRAKYYLNFSTPIELVVASIISAQTRDEVVNSITPQLFLRYKSVQEYAVADPSELSRYISRVSFAQNKAKNIISTCKELVEKYDGKVPKSLDELTALPGIGRKTANTILINAYGIVQGIPVDTWVIKLSMRIGLSKNKDPEKIEQDLMKFVDKKYWKNFAYVLKTHGKKICQSQVPLCSACQINKLCPKIGVTKSK